MKAKELKAAIEEMNENVIVLATACGKGRHEREILTARGRNGEAILIDAYSVGKGKDTIRKSAEEMLLDALYKQKTSANGIKVGKMKCFLQNIDPEKEVVFATAFGREDEHEHPIQLFKAENGDLVILDEESVRYNNWVYSQPFVVRNRLPLNPKERAEAVSMKRAARKHASA